MRRYSQRIHKSKGSIDPSGAHPPTLNKVCVLCCPLVVEVKGPVSYPPLCQPLEDQRHALPPTPIVDIFVAQVQSEAAWLPCESNLFTLALTNAKPNGRRQFGIGTVSLVVVLTQMPRSFKIGSEGRGRMGKNSLHTAGEKTKTK